MYTERCTIPYVCVSTGRAGMKKVYEYIFFIYNAE